MCRGRLQERETPGRVPKRAAAMNEDSHSCCARSAVCQRGSVPPCSCLAHRMPKRDPSVETIATTVSHDAFREWLGAGPLMHVLRSQGRVTHDERGRQRHRARARGLPRPRRVRRRQHRARRVLHRRRAFRGRATRRTHLIRIGHLTEPLHLFWGCPGAATEWWCPSPADSRRLRGERGSRGTGRTRYRWWSRCHAPGSDLER